MGGKRKAYRDYILFMNFTSYKGKAILSMKYAGLNICKWPNNDHNIGYDIILKFNGSNSTLKTNLSEENCSSPYKSYLRYILK